MDSFAQNPALWWLSFGIFLLVLEVVGNTLFFLWFSGAMFVTALVTWLFAPSPTVQALVFAVATVLALLGWQRYRPLQKMEGRDAASGLNNRLSGFVGRELVLTEAISNGQGRVHLDDTYWNAVGDDMPAGTHVRIAAVEGMTFRLERI
jgi:membrane protein implicated in regulation of membrane protease activity